MTFKCAICGKTSQAQTYVRLDDSFESEKIHIKCFVKKFVEPSLNGQKETKEEKP
jgi:hypothetical protein